jgi:ectoine hydroxylase-related dioxygenase (phytanoyl-CoA dioxygenase family)
MGEENVMAVLSEAQKDAFWTDGYLVLENAVSPDLLAKLKSDFSSWVEESRDHDRSYGEIIDGRPRFDLEKGHSSDQPALRRVNAPIEVSDAYYEAMADSRMTDFVAELIGPNVKLHHTKINSKLPGAATVVKWHQDFPFTPHSNDDLVTALLMVDDVTEENGPLEVTPGTHRGPLHGLWREGVFTGSVEDTVAEASKLRAVLCTGKAGSVCLMHTRLLHGSTANLSDQPRTLFISVYSAEDAVPLVPNPVPTRFEGEIVRGEPTGKVRSIAFDLELPQKPSTASFFDQQSTRGVER